MKKLLISICLLTASFSANASQVMAQISPSHGKVGHAFESYSVHAFYVVNNDRVTHTYKWLVKQCPMYDGTPKVCPENDGGKLTLTPGQEYRFSRKLVMQLKCGAERQSISTYAMSSLDSDNPNDQFLIQEATSNAKCT